MKYFACAIFASVSINAVADTGSNIPTIDSYKVCDAYFKKEPGSAENYEALKKYGFEMDRLCALVKEEQEGQPSPKYLPINMMVQFYDVPEHQVSVEVVEQTPQKATVIASVPRGHRCTFELVRAPSGINVPSGWLTAAPECVRRGAGGIPVIDGAALEEARKAAKSQNEQ